MLLRIITFMIGIISLIYFGMYAAFTGLTNKFTYFWLLFGIVCILIAVKWKHIWKLLKAAPTLPKIMGTAVIVTCLLVLIIAEGLVAGYGVSTPGAGADDSGGRIQKHL